MKKRVNITRDVESRRNIARGAGFAVPAASPDKTECHDTKNESRCRKVSLRPPQPGTKNRGGRPRGSFKRFPFNQTPIGFMLYNEAPAVYNILMLLCPHSQRRFPHPQTVALVCTASDDPALRKPKFRRYMKRYEREGCYCRRGKLLTPERERYYARLRRTLLDRYIVDHWAQIVRMQSMEEITHASTTVEIPHWESDVIRAYVKNLK